VTIVTIVTIGPHRVTVGPYRHLTSLSSQAYLVRFHPRSTLRGCPVGPARAAVRASSGAGLSSTGDPKGGRAGSALLRLMAADPATSVGCPLEVKPNDAGQSMTDAGGNAEGLK